MYVYSGGVAKTAVGWNNVHGSYIYNSPSNRYLGIKDNGTPHFQGNTLWHAGNDGSRSGLDADLLDGFHKSDIYDNVTICRQQTGGKQRCPRHNRFRRHLLPDAAVVATSGYRPLYPDEIQRKLAGLEAYRLHHRQRCISDTPTDPAHAVGSEFRRHGECEWCDDCELHGRDRHPA